MKLNKVLKKNNNIPIHRQKIVIDGEEMTDNNEIINYKKFYSFGIYFKGPPKESDFINIQVKDLRRRSNKKDFYLKIDLYADILSQICKYLSISYENHYLSYKEGGIFSQLSHYFMIKNYHSGKPIIFQLYDICREGNMKIYINRISGTTRSYYVYPSTRIIELKLIMDEKPDEVRLIYNCQILDNCKTLAFYNIKEGSRLNLILSLRGG